MSDALLRTKVVVPPLRPGLLARRQLMSRLDESLRPGTRLSLVSAPAGYGKTTALVQWAHLGHALAGWLALDPADNDFERFFRYLVTAWKEVVPEVAGSPLDLLLGSITPDREKVLTAFVNLAAGIPEPAALVLDDYHLIEEPAIHQALAFLVDHLPPALHFILAARGVPALPLARFRARGELLELGIDELRFDQPESQALLAGLAGRSLSAEQIKAVGDKLEGWAAGLQLVGLALRQGLASADRLALDGRQRFVADYWRDELMAGLPPEIERFLLHTCLLERLCAPLCEAVTGQDGGQAYLDRLERNGLFLTPLDDRREWFRYHPLFAEFLRQELERRFPEMVAGLHRRAGRWYLDQALYEPAFDHALAGLDGRVVNEIAERRFDLMLHTGELKLVRRWLDALPEAWLYEYPVIGLTQAQWLGLTGDLPGCLRQVNRVERAIRESARPDRRWQLARVNTVLCTIACFQNDLARAEPLAEQALSDLPESDHHYRATIHHALGEAYRHVGRWQEARAEYHQVLALVEDPASQLRLTHVYGALADVELRQGRLKDAAGYWQEALAVIEAADSWGYLPLPLTGWVYVRMAEIRYEWHELVAATELAERGLALAEVGGVVQALIAGYLTAGRLRLARGDPEAAAAYLERARPLVAREGFQQWAGRFQRLQLDIWLSQDRPGAAAGWAKEMLRDDRPAKAGSETLLTVARALIMTGGAAAAKQSRAMLAELEQTAAAEGRMGVQIEALALKALAGRQHEGSAEAMSALERALRLAEPEGYIRMFADLGYPMARLLQAAEARSVMPAYVARLLAAFGEDWLSVAERTLPERLTRRETEVLGLIAAGLTNQEIADRLVISPETVKKHVGQIYNKLGVKGRTEAAVLARQWELLN